MKYFRLIFVVGLISIIGYITYDYTIIDIYIMRHGKTDKNKKDKLVYGQDGLPLTDKGRKDIEHIAKELSIKNQTLYTSPQKRAVETAEIVAEATGSEISIDPRLRERDHADIGRETKESQFKRVMDFFNQTIRIKTKGLWVITHGGVIGGLLQHAGIKEKLPIKNGSIFKFKYNKLTKKLFFNRIVGEKMSKQIVRWEESVAPTILDFLYQHKETALFLLDNYQHYGPSLGESIFSGNFKIIMDGEKIHAVFCLTRSGNLLIQSDGKEDYSAEIYKACLDEDMPVTGFVGNWKDGDLFWKYIQKVHPKVKPKNLSKEKLYVLNLSEETGVKHEEVRFLNEQDFNNWYKLDQQYSKELNFPEQGTMEQQRQQFKQKCDRQHWWGLGASTIASFNASVDSVAQIGGVYTDPACRRQGHAAKVIETLIWDAYHQHDIRSLILFTGDTNTAAQRLYEKLGFKPIGYFGLLFWDNG